METNVTLWSFSNLKFQLLHEDLLGTCFYAAFLFGDPHIVTLDGKAYTFNGAGEYVIIDALNKAFLVQARSEPAERVDGGQPVGTVFTAIAAKANHSVPIEVQKSSLRGINILVNGERLPLTEPREWQFAGVVVSYEGNNSVFIRFGSGAVSYTHLTLPTIYSV